ncbi:scavenger receptor cysteine-rich domain superfamily protein [Aplysia californica]|uniref:Scavenger receptor cysteine-rich domain superfamily protein n=1 Tax=Aplysia californica TaxID=6500 RepID=A0ABM1A0R8_APLCA|nr:scavenger receptor cysteine-rich domain superfamily protein [Aplysia californica]
MESRIKLLAAQVDKRLTAHLQTVQTLVDSLATDHRKPSQGDLRLVTQWSSGPVSSGHAGYLQFFTGTTWGFICDDGFRPEAARVACRQLGYTHTTGSSGVITSSNHSSVDLEDWMRGYEIVLDDVTCDGGDGGLRLDSCSHALIGHHDCHVTEAVFISCSPANQTG